MDSKYLFEGESIITQSKDSKVVLTNYRLRYQESSASNARVISIMLEKISSIEVHYKSYPVYIILGILIGGMGYFFSGGLGSRMELQLKIVCLVVAVLFVLVYFMSRRHMVSVASSGATIDFHTRGMRRDSILEFVNKIEQAKHDNRIG